MKKFFYTIWSKLLSAFGNIKCFRYPFWLVYDPDDYEVTGKQVLEIMSVLEPGDIILRGYRHYLDGKFVPNFRNTTIGQGFSHGAIYVGGNQVIHAVAEGVSYVNVLDFMQCDRIAIFRSNKHSGKQKAVKIAKKFAKDNVPYDFAFDRDASALYCFELCVECYPNLDIKMKEVSKLFGILKKHVYVAQSFIDSPDLDLIYCWNPKSKIDFCA